MAEKYITSETRVITNTGSDYFDNRVVNYSDGSAHTFKDWVGDVDALLGAYKGRMIQRAAEYATAARVAVNATAGISEALTWAADVDTATSGDDPAQLIHLDYETDLETSGWQINDGGGDLALVFTVDANGDCTYTIDGGSSFTAYYLVNAIRLEDYPTGGTDTDFFIMDDGSFKNIDGSVEITTP